MKKFILLCFGLIVAGFATYAVPKEDYKIFKKVHQIEVIQEYQAEAVSFKDQESQSYDSEKAPPISNVKDIQFALSTRRISIDFMPGLRAGRYWSNGERFYITKSVLPKHQFRAGGDTVFKRSC